MKTFIYLFLLISIIGCSSSGKKNQSAAKMNTFEKGTYGYDLKILKAHTKPIELKNEESRVLISPEYQGRVMTSSSEGENGLSYGWINHDLISSGETLPHINPVGGEERFWLGPEGGQYSIFFKSGDTFDFENWQTPPCIDTEKYDLVFANDTEAEFSKTINLTNYNNFVFEFNVNRKISLLNNEKIKTELGIVFQNEVKSVGFKTVNSLKNSSAEDWKKENGLLSIWLLGMFNPSPEVTVIIPYKTEAESDYIVKDDYFGKVPSDRLVVKNGIVFFKGDGNQRGKIGIPPQRALPIIGSYDSENNLLTIVKCEVPEGINDYVNSAWEQQKYPFKGDAINSYNDGPLEDGGQLGPFYELETSSPALALKSGETSIYQQSTIHFQGTDEELNAICQQVFDISLVEIKTVF